MGEARGGERVTRSRKGARRTPAVRKAARPAAVRGATPDRMAMGKDDLLFEIGVEELPASYVAPALEQMEHLARTALEELRLSCARLETFGTPRRLALVVRGVAVRQTDIEEEIQGPASRVAFSCSAQDGPAMSRWAHGVVPTNSSRNLAAEIAPPIRPTPQVIERGSERLVVIDRGAARAAIEMTHEELVRRGNDGVHAERLRFQKVQ